MIKHYYETLFIVMPDIGDDERSQVYDKFKNFLQNNGSEILKFEPWQLQKLAYKIKKKTHGYYVLVEHITSPDIIKELTREFRLDERILRFMTIKKGERFDLPQKRQSLKI